MPNIDVQRRADVLVVGLGGDWRLGDPVPAFDEVLDDASTGDAHAVGFDADRLGDWDSSLLAFLLDGWRTCERRDLDFRDDDLPPDIARLMELARAVPERDVERGEDGDDGVLARLGRRGLDAWASAGSSLAFLGRTALGFARLPTGGARFRWRDFWLVVQSNSAGALPIVTLISFLVGLIIAFLGAVVLERFGAGYYVSYLVSYGILRELGALMTGIIMAGRTGAAFAAELGSMKISEELDAFRTLGIDPVDYLVLPRILAVFLMLPLLTIYADAVGILGGMAVALTMLDLSAAQFTTGLLAPVVLSDALLGLFKGLAFGLIIGVSGCMRGLQTGDDAGAVGKAATAAVVTGITFIIFANALIDWAAAMLGI